MKSVRKFTWGRRNKMTEHREKAEPVDTLFFFFTFSVKGSYFFFLPKRINTLWGGGSTSSLGEIARCPGETVVPKGCQSLYGSNAQDPENSQLMPGPPLRKVPMALKRKTMCNMEVMEHGTLA